MFAATPDEIIAEYIRAAFPLEGGTRSANLPSIADWQPVVESAEENAVAPLLYAALKKCRRDDSLPADWIERLRVDYLRSDTANWLALSELQSLLAALDRAQIPAVVLKGGALATTLYPEPALRPMSDLDLLIQRSQFEQVEALLIERGYASPVEMGEGFGLQLTNYRAYTRSGKNPAHVELHWHLFKSPYYCQRVPIEWFWDRTTEILIGNQRAKVFTLEALFLHLAAHYSLHHRAERLIWSYDLARLLSNESGRMDWGMLLDAVERFGLASPFALAVARVARTWRVSTPAAVSSRLKAVHAKWQDRLAFAMMTARRGEARFLLDATSQPTVALMARFWSQHLFPSRAYMRERYRIRNERWAPLYYAWRLVEGPWKILRSMSSTISQDR